MVVLPTVGGLGNHTPPPRALLAIASTLSPLLRWVSRGHGVSHGVGAEDSGGLKEEQVWGD